MTLLKLVKDSIRPIIAYANHNRAKSELHYAVTHGTAGSNFGYWMCKINTHINKPSKLGDEVELRDNSYILIPLKNSKGFIKDKLGNNIYYINKDNNTVHKRDIVVFWEIPNINYVNVTYSLSGSVYEIGVAYNGKDRGDIVFKAPAPIIEVFGDCLLKWEATDVHGNTYSQQIEYRHGDAYWDIQPIKNLPLQGIKDASN